MKPKRNPGHRVAVRGVGHLFLLQYNSVLTNFKTKLLNAYQIDESSFLGKGRESSTYALDKGRVLKIFVSGDKEFLLALAVFYHKLALHPLPFHTPQILEVGEKDGIVFTVEKRLPGKALDQVFPTLNEKKKLVALENYFKAIRYYNLIQFPDLPYGQIIKVKQVLTANTWPEFVLAKFEKKIAAQPRLIYDVTDYLVKVERMRQAIKNGKLDISERSLVHADYYFTNVLVDDQLQVSAVLDFGEHAVVGDRRMDVAAAVDFLNVSSDVTPEMHNFVRDLARQEYGKEIDWYINFYALFYNFYFADTKDEELYRWSIKGLNNEKAWELLTQLDSISKPPSPPQIL